MLNKKFAGGGIRYWYQESPSIFDSPPWPLLVHRLRHLQRFSLIDLLEHSGTRIKNVDLSALPRSLKSLQLSFVGAIAAFASTISRHPSHFEELESLEISGVERNRAYGTTGNKEKMDLPILIFDTLEHIVWPSTLQHLLIGQPGEVFTLGAPDQEDQYAPILVPMRFPLGLQSLRICMGHLCCYWSEESPLPPGLTSLDVRTLYKEEWIWWKFLPSSLVHCLVNPHHGYTGASPLYQLDSSYLPRGLKTFAFHATIEASEQFARDLPRSLTLLHIYPSYGNFSDLEFVRLLPQSLTNLPSGCYKLVTDAIAEFLPRGLTHLDQLVSSWRALIRLPRSLTYMSFHSATLRGRLSDLEGLIKEKRDFEASACLDYLPSFSNDLHLSPSYLFPPNLTSIRIPGFDKFTHFLLPLLPNLKRIEVLMDGIMNTSDSMILPRGLEHIHLGRNFPLDESMVLSLPRSLTFLSAHFLFKPDFSFSILTPEHLPQHLTSLQAHVFLLLDDDVSTGWFSNLPASLLNLDLTVCHLTLTAADEISNACKGLVSMSIHHFHYHHPLMKEFMSSSRWNLGYLSRLPQSLRKLDITGVETYNMTVDEVAAIPRRVKFMTLQHVRIMEQFGPLLPPFLSELRYQFASVDGSSRWFYASKRMAEVE